MCGIAGIIGASAEWAETHCDDMLRAMIHRGPDQGGVWRADAPANVVFGHRRLSILDLSDAGRQPMVDRRTGRSLVFNGECYNYRELRVELEALGHEFKSGSDTEVVLAALVEWGDEAIARLRGMFAIATWDPVSKTILLARDRLGIKPLYFAQCGNVALFASELRAMLASGLVTKEVDPEALQAYLWHGFVPGPSTLVRGVRLLKAGGMLLLSMGGEVLREEKYWHLPAMHEPGGVARAGATARDALQQAVHLHLASDVPLGIFLSGGVDSSVIAALAQASSGDAVSTFNIRFEEADYDESRHARQVAKILGTSHHEVMLRESDFDAGLEEAMRSIDQPTFDAINTYFVSRAVREAGLTVALAGTGGDELFGGYESFRSVPRARLISELLRWMPRRVRRVVGAAGSRLMMGSGSEVPPQTRWGKLVDILGVQGEMVAAYQVSYALFSQDLHRELNLVPECQLEWGLYPEQARELRELVRNQPDNAAVSMLEISSFLTERLLRDTDAASMAVSLEVRVPLLDHVFIERLSEVDVSERFLPLGKKRWLKECVREWLPPEIFDRPKAGFELPLDAWCRHSLSSRMESVLTDINLAHAIGLNAEAVGRVWRSFKKGGKGIYWSRVWGLYVLMSWCRSHDLYLSRGRVAV